MNAILFIGHGTKKREGNEQLLQFVESMKGDIPYPIVETCFLEFSTPTIREGIKRCVDQGATKVGLVPMMFFSAGHAKIHIPVEIDEAKAMYPHVEFNYGRPIGVHDKVFDILQSRLLDVGFSNDKGKEEVGILLVGRGSSDADANSELYKIGRLLSEKLEMVNVELSFIGVTSPTVEEGVARSIKLGVKKIYIIPYFFFTGILMDRMVEKLQSFQVEYPELQFSMTEFFGFHPILKTIFVERAQEALQGEAKLNCDVCSYRLHAMEHMDIHHHHDHDHHDHHHGHTHDHNHQQEIQR
ncbi:sirohydrochlorin chelatase [Alkalihalobacterium chitinilyticum]|uniref:Sirohydrochlorin chelatase n=1 Tax=Alkalihalobacterium chitinilyticum TaxID=2980103 RepID=A0ABT5VBT0_9BACI|nr:sirohydrochlorin chelatase [Alkalihalobacterium chitinilyticum]MDE5412167.1 sirohydrochlorin chelatase [Alkalihalobacterium chitinilyticum]